MRATALNTLVNPTPRELALKLLDGRIRLLADTLLVLRHVRHSQSIVGASRQRLVNDGYDYRNWQLHSGAAGVNGLTDETLTALSANALHVAHTIAIGSLELIATELRVDSRAMKATPTLLGCFGKLARAETHQQ